MIYAYAFFHIIPPCTFTKIIFQPDRDLQFISFTIFWNFIFTMKYTDSISQFRK